MLLSVVIPVYNEADSLPKLFPALRQVLAKIDCDHELIFINDGSKDDTCQILATEAEADSHVKILGFSRNFGHQVAITAGLDFASGDAAVVMDADLQDPPEILPEMVALYHRGYDVVSAQRIVRDGESFFKRATASLFYLLMRRMVDERVVPEVGDFRLFSRTAVVALRSFREQHRFMRGIVAWLGLKEVILPFHRPARSAGSSKYSLFKMICFAWTAISSFSALPLRLGLAVGALITTSGFLYFVYALFMATVERTTVPGWTSLVCLQVIFSGAILMAIGLLGDYIARIYEEAKGRPLYIVATLENISSCGPPVERALMLSRPVARAPLNRESTRP